MSSDTFGSSFGSPLSPPPTAPSSTSTTSSLPPPTDSELRTSFLLIATASLFAGASIGYGLQQWFSRRARQRTRLQALENEYDVLANNDDLEHKTGDQESYQLPAWSLTPTAQTLSALELGSETCRELFCLNTRHATQLNHGSYGTVPRKVMKYHTLCLRKVEDYPDLWMRKKSFPLCRMAINPFALILQCDARDLVWVNNATSAVNAVIHSLPLKKEDIVITLDTTYNACKLALQHACKKAQATYHEIPLPLPLKSPEETYNYIISYLTSADKIDVSKIKFALFDVITSPTAIVMPYRQLAEWCHKKNILTFLDGAHAIGQVPLNLSETDAYDFFTTNCHKWMYCPKGSALLWTNKRHQSYIHPTVTSHNWRGTYAERFWMQGTREDSVYLAASQGCQFATDIGLDRIKEYNSKLLDAGCAILLKKWGQKVEDSVVCPVSMSAPNMRLIATPITIPSGTNPAKYAEFLMFHFMNTYHVVVPFIYEAHTNKIYVRPSAQIYNTIQDYERLAEVVLTYTTTSNRVVPTLKFD